MTTIPAAESDILTPLVTRQLVIEEITWGDSSHNYLVRYRGTLRRDSMEAYDWLAKALRPHRLTPLFRNENGQHAIILTKGIVEPKPSNSWINVLMFFLTLLSMLVAGTMYSYDGPVPEGSFGLIRVLLSNMDLGLSFGVSLLSILLAHELGHYLAGRLHKTSVTLPYFLPFPFSPFGTLGAFIQLKEPPKNKRILLDIGIAGPIAGLLVAIPVLLIGLSLSPVERLPLFIEEGQAFNLEGNSILYLLMKYIVHGQWLPQPGSFMTVSPLSYWLKYIFTGLPTPLGGYDVMLHPMAWAGWAGLLVTSLNLIPAGQLDGGHILFVLLGKRVRRLLPAILIGLTLLGMAWEGWWLWVILIFVFGRVYAEPLDQITPLGPKRKAVAIFGIILFILVFIPVPLTLLIGPYVGP
jgi:hypothetical protein